jgi:hypothetical protein
MMLYVLAGFPTAALAQGNPMPTTNVLSIYRESVKVGKGPAHDSHETAWAGALVAAKSPNKFIAATALTGPSEIWYIAAYPLWTDYEKANATALSTPGLAAIAKQYVPAESDYLSDARQMTLRPRTELGYGGPADLPNMRYLSVTRVSIRPGHTAEYEEARRMIKAAHEAAHLSDRFSVWEATSGAPAGTFFTFVARKTLAELDSTAAVHGTAYTAAMGGDEGQKKLAALNAGAIISQQTDIFEFTPSQSVPPDEWVTANPGFWKRKAPAKKTP